MRNLQKLLALALAIALFPLAVPASAGDDAEEVALDLDVLRAGVPAEAVRLDAEGPWKLVEGAPSTTFRAVMGGDPAEMSITVEDADAFGFVAELEGRAVLHFAVDGSVVKTLRTRSDGPFDLALDPGRHVLSWRLEGGTGHGSALVVMVGARSVVPPIVDVPEELRGCFLSSLPVTISGAAAVPVGGVRARLDGVPLEATAVSARSGHRVVTDVDLVLPPLAEGTTTSTLEIGIEDATGTVWDVVRRTVKLVSELAVIAGPHGWVYDLRPTISLLSLCPLDSLASMTFTLDGEDATDEVSRGLLTLTYGFERELAFREEHSYRFDLEFKGGLRIVREGVFREGLDVVEFNVSGGVITVASTPGVTTFSNPARPDELPPVATTFGKGIGKYLTYWLPLDGAHFRAAYAPLAIECASYRTAKACSPYGGDAPGFFPGQVAGATLEVSTRGGKHLATLPALGQFAVASRESRVPSDPFALFDPQHVRESSLYPDSDWVGSGFLIGPDIP